MSVPVVPVQTEEPEELIPAVGAGFTVTEIEAVSVQVPAETITE